MADGLRGAVLTVSDGVFRGVREDQSGDLLTDLLSSEGFEVARRVVPDEQADISAALRQLAETASVVLTTGGTGLAKRDVTPEATLDVLDRMIPGIPEALRADAISRTPHGLLSRSTAGTIGATLIVNLPGSPGGCRDGFEILRPALKHAIALLADAPTAHRQT